METFAPLINLLVLLSTLSITAERLANLVKPRHVETRQSREQVCGAGEKERERRIGNRVLVVSVLLAVAVKADFFAIVSHLDAPWDTLGWTRDVPVHSPAELLTTILGTILTGLSLGFGSKFWHDVLDIVYGARDNLRRHGRRAERPAHWDADSGHESVDVRQHRPDRPDAAGASSSPTRPGSSAPTENSASIAVP